MLPPDLFSRLDLSAAVAAELQVRNRLLPRRWDYAALAPRAAEVVTKLKPAIRRGRPVTTPADVILADKGWRGVRPLNIMSLQDRIVYRALVDLIKQALPDHLRERPPISDFRQAPLTVGGVEYVTKTDVTAYYQYIDHDLLADELVAQTGEEPAVSELNVLLRSLMGRGIGIPQVHPASDILGDTYLDPVRRRLAREGLMVFRYSDDFRIASKSLGQARRALEACATAVRERGLVLNERKTFTYRKTTYLTSLDSFRAAERELFADPNGTELSVADFFLLEDSYSDEEVDQESAGGEKSPAASATLGSTPIVEAVDEDEVTTEHDDVDGTINSLGGTGRAPDKRRARAVDRAWHLWLDEDEGEDAQSSVTASITQSLLGRALPELGATGDDRPITNLGVLLRLEPALTPQLAAYIIRYARTSSRAQSEASRALSAIAQDDFLSPWQAIWLAQAAGSLDPLGGDQLDDWLMGLVSTGRDALAATAGAALGRRGTGDPAVLARRLDEIRPEWRTLLLYGLGHLAPHLAIDTVDSEFDRLLLSTLPL